MDKIVDHLFVFRGNGVIEDLGITRIFERMKTALNLQKGTVIGQYRKEQLEKSKTAGLTFNEQKEFQKIEKEIKDLEWEKKKIEDLFSEGKVADADIEKKANELQSVIQKIEKKEERWFELSSKMES
jgi:ATP-binding cassette subfamily F protein uup